MLWPHSNGRVVTSRGDTCSVVPGGWGLWSEAALPPYAAPYGFRCSGGGDAELLAQVTCIYEVLVVECGCSPLDDNPVEDRRACPWLRLLLLCSCRWLAPIPCRACEARVGSGSPGSTWASWEVSSRDTNQLVNWEPLRTTF